jgi:electron transport complex protein RnfG
MTDSPKEPAFKKRVGYHGTLLAAFSFLAATLLIMGNIGTRDAIEQRIAEDLQASLGQVIPATIHDNDLLKNRVIIKHQDKEIVAYQGIKNNKTTSIAYNVSGQGYAGEISLIMGVNADGEVLGVRVLSHTETPGLGDKIEVEKDDWIYSFDGLSFKKLSEEKWKVKKDGGIFDQFSGATITPRIIVKAIHRALTEINAEPGVFYND